MKRTIRILSCIILFIYVTLFGSVNDEESTSVQVTSSEYIEYAVENNIDRNNAKHNLVYMAILVVMGGAALCVVLFRKLKKYK